jgi:hypothetical protein
VKKSTFITFDLKPKDIAGLKPFEKQHLLNHTNAWIDKRTKDIQSSKKIILTLTFGLLGSIVLIFMIYIFLTAFFVYPNFAYGSATLSSIFFTLAILNGKHISVFRINQIKQRIGSVGNPQKSVRFYFLKDHVKQLLTSQSQNLIHTGKWAYIRKQGVLALFCVVLAILGYLVHLMYGAYIDQGIYNIPEGLTYQEHQEIADLFVLIKYILFMPSVTFLILFIKKTIDIFTAIIK